jgi:hypothetical protein
VPAQTEVSGETVRTGDGAIVIMFVVVSDPKALDATRTTVYVPELVKTKSPLAVVEFNVSVPHANH